jgi:hypothetical protein
MTATRSTPGRKGLCIPPATLHSPEGRALENEKAPESREPSIKFKLPSLHFSPSRRRR